MFTLILEVFTFSKQFREIAKKFINIGAKNDGFDQYCKSNCKFSEFLDEILLKI